MSKHRLMLHTVSVIALPSIHLPRVIGAIEQALQRP